MKYRFKPAQQFWESFYALPSDQKESTRKAWKIFKINPFDPRLRPHKIHRLSAYYRRTIHAVETRAICVRFSMSKAIWSSRWISELTTSIERKVKRIE
jgi:hypothetical protein